MMFLKKILPTFLIAIICFNTSADNIIVTSTDSTALDFQKLREDLDRLQAHVYTNISLDEPESSKPATQTPEEALENFDTNRANAQLGSKMQELRNEMADLKGKLEETNHTLKLQTTKIEKLEQQLTAAQSEIAASKTAPISPTPAVKDSSANTAPAIIEAVAPPEPALTSAEMIANEIKRLDPKEAYEKAKAYISQGDYDKAEIALKTFVEAFPAHELTGAAYYYLGELYYIQKKFKEALSIFAEGYKSQPKGAKAPDGLLKMAQCFDALKQLKEACATLTQLHKAFPKLDSVPKSTAKKLGTQLKCPLKDKSK